jgi:hypothetical protein
VFCAPLRTSVEIAFPTTSDALGLIALPTFPQRLTFPLPQGIGLQVYSQYAAVDAAMRVYLSDAAVLGCVPHGPTLTPAVTRITNPGSDSEPTGTATALYCLVARFDY